MHFFSDQETCKFLVSIGIDKKGCSNNTDCKYRERLDSFYCDCKRGYVGAPEGCSGEICDLYGCLSEYKHSGSISENIKNQMNIYLQSSGFFAFSARLFSLD